MLLEALFCQLRMCENLGFRLTHNFESVSMMLMAAGRSSVAKCLQRIACQTWCCYCGHPYPTARCANKDEGLTASFARAIKTKKRVATTNTASPAAGIAAPSASAPSTAGTKNGLVDRLTVTPDTDSTAPLELLFSLHSESTLLAYMKLCIDAVLQNWPRSHSGLL